MENLRFVVLDNIYEGIDDTEVRELFNRIIELKKKGYSAEYKFGVLPIDTSDFIATHLAVCKETKEGLVPIMAYRSTRKTRCEQYNLPFSALALMRACNAPLHEKAVSLFLEQSKFVGVDVSYDASWTIDPEIRKDRDYTKKLQELMMATHVLYHLEAGIPRIIAGGVLRFKMQKYYEFWGYRPLAIEGKELPSIGVPFVHNEATQFFTLTKFSDEALALADKYRSYWENMVSVESKTNVGLLLGIPA